MLMQGGKDNLMNEAKNFIISIDTQNGKRSGENNWLGSQTKWIFHETPAKAM